MPEGVIKDNSILKMLENSLTDGALYHLRDPSTGTGDVNNMLAVVKYQQHLPPYASVVTTTESEVTEITET